MIRHLQRRYKLLAILEGATRQIESDALKALLKLQLPSECLKFKA